MINQPIKAISKDSPNIPFYLIQSNGTDKRYVVSLNDKLHIRVLLAGFINQSNDKIEIKIKETYNTEKQIEYYGLLYKSILHKLMTKHEDVIFHNGFHDFMLKNCKTGDYIVFDEHGLIFIYTKKDYEKILKNFNTTHKPNEKLIYEYKHWHFCLPDCQKKFIEMISDFKLKRVS